MRSPSTLPLTTLLFLAFSGVHAQVDSAAMRYAATITQGELRSHLTILAGDAFLGRDSGKEGQKLAAQYLKEQFVETGIQPVPPQFGADVVDGYFQAFDLVETRSGTISLNAEGVQLRYGKELAYFNESLKSELNIERLLFLPEGEKVAKDELMGRVVLLDAGPAGVDNSTLGQLRSRLDAVREGQPVLILVSVREIGGMMKGMHLGGTHMRLAEGTKKDVPAERVVQTVFVDEVAMNGLLRKTNMLKLRKKRRRKELPVRVNVQVNASERVLTSENVLAYIEGTDKKEELVVLTAHYDHIGVENGVVYNGADDDGTGTVAMIEIAEAFAQAAKEGHGPRRSILVMPVSAEEKGLLGSRYYSEHPVFPLANTVADLNIDMIGRTDSVHRGAAPYVYIIGSDRLSTELHAINEQANLLYGRIELDYRFNAEDDPNRFYYRSDHYNFARKGVPSIFYFSGVHEDYHQPGDDVEKIQFDLLEQRTRLVFHTAWILANREDRIVVDRPVKP